MRRPNTASWPSLVLANGALVLRWKLNGSQSETLTLSRELRRYED